MHYDKLGRPATNFWFEAGASYPSNSVEYYYNALGQLTNITERSGDDASSTYFASIRSRPRNRFFAALAKVPPEVKGGVSGLVLATLSFFGLLLSRSRVPSLSVVGDDVRRLTSRTSTGGSGGNRGFGLQSLFSLFAPVKSLFAYLACFAVNRKSRSAYSAYSAVKLPRLLLPGLFWRFATFITIICLLGSDPRLDFWTLHAECVYP